MYPPELQQAVLPELLRGYTVGLKVRYSFCSAQLQLLILTSQLTCIIIIITPNTHSMGK